MNTEGVNEARTTVTPVLLTVIQFSAKHLFVTPGGLRFQIFNANENGLEKSGAIVRIGRRVLINEEKYFAWIESQQKKGCV
jgi:hypothetical protein